MKKSGKTWGCFSMSQWDAEGKKNELYLKEIEKQLGHQWKNSTKQEKREEKKGDVVREESWTQCPWLSSPVGRRNDSRLLSVRPRKAVDIPPTTTTPSHQTHAPHRLQTKLQVLVSQWFLWWTGKVNNQERSPVATLYDSENSDHPSLPPSPHPTFVSLFSLCDPLGSTRAFLMSVSVQLPTGTWVTHQWLHH